MKESIHRKNTNRKTGKISVTLRKSRPPCYPPQSNPVDGILNEVAPHIDPAAVRREYQDSLPIHTTIACTHKHRTRQFLMAPVLWLQNTEIDSFLDQLEKLWNPGTIESALASLLKPAARLEVGAARMSDLRDMVALYKKRRIANGGWDPEDLKHIVTPNDARALHAEISKADNLETKRLLTAALLAWLTGSRIGDMLKLRKDQCNISGNTIVLTEHKTALSIGPMSFQLPEYALNLVQSLVHEQSTGRYLFLPPEVTNADERDIARAERRLKTRSQTLKEKDLRGLRRGGSVNASQEAHTNAELRMLTHHTKDASLRVYMAAGRLSATEGRTQMRLISHNINACRSNPNLTSAVQSPGA